MKAVLKERYRYVVFKLISTREFSKDELERELNNAILKVIGEIGLAACMPRVIEYRDEKGIVRVLRDGTEQFLTVMALVTRLSGVPAHMMTLRTSGTIAGTKKKKV
jgi:RNase P/RNase MRP subunit POP5